MPRRSLRFYGGLIHAPPPETTGYLCQKPTLVIGTGTKTSVEAVAALSTPAHVGHSPAIRYRIPLTWYVYSVASGCCP